MAIYSDSGFETGRDLPSIRPTLDLNFAATKTLDRRITFSRDSLGTYTDEFGVVRTAPNNVPRFDHDPTTGESLGLLVEESRTNYVSTSNMSNWTIIGFTGRSLDSIGPDGVTNSAISLTEVTGTNPGQYVIYADHNVSNNNQTFTHSVFVKPSSSYNWQLNVHNIGSGGNTSNFSVIFNTNTKTFTNTAGGPNSPTIEGYGYQEYSNGWFRIWATCNVGNSDQTTTNLRFHVRPLNASQTGNYTGTGALTGYVFGAQIELGSFPTSYIPTSGITVTRNKDIAVIKGTNFTDVFDTNFKEFSLLVDYDNSKTDDGSYYEIVSFWGESPGFDDRISITKDDQSPYHIETRAFGGGGGIFANGNLSASSKAATQKLATSWSVPDYSNTSSRRWAFCFSGETPIDVVPDSTGTSVPAITRLGLGISPTRLNENEVGGLIHYKRFVAYNKALPDAQLQSLTS